MDGDTLLVAGEAALISAYINICFIVAEVAFVVYGPKGEFREALDTLAHILAGPISFLGFLNGGFMGSLCFFLSLWHFLCDSGRARPSYVRVCPRNRHEFLVWFESFWLLLHHWYIGAFKLLSTDLASQLPGIKFNSGDLRFYVRWWACGATLSHLSFGMQALGMKNHVYARVLSVVLRMGSAALIVALRDNLAVRVAYAWDLVWMTVIITLTICKAVCGGKKADETHDVVNPAAGVNSSDSPEVEHASTEKQMEVRLTKRLSVVAKQRRKSYRLDRARADTAGP